jgi:hypothetical protein
MAPYVTVTTITTGQSDASTVHTAVCTWWANYLANLFITFSAQLAAYCNGIPMNIAWEGRLSWPASSGKIVNLKIRAISLLSTNYLCCSVLTENHIKRENTRTMLESLTGTSGVAYDVKLAVYIGSQHGVSSELWTKCRAAKKARYDKSVSHKECCGDIRHKVWLWNYCAFSGLLPRTSRTLRTVKWLRSTNKSTTTVKYCSVISLIVNNCRIMIIAV